MKIIRWIISQIQEQANVLHRSILLKILLKESSSLHVYLRERERERKRVNIDVFPLLPWQQTRWQSYLHDHQPLPYLEASPNHPDDKSVQQSTTTKKLLKWVQSVGVVITSLWGNPAAEKIGIFWPRAILFMASMAEMPVCIISSG